MGILSATSRRGPICPVAASHKALGDVIASTIRAIEAGKPYLEAMVEVGLLRRRDVSAVFAAERRLSGEASLRRRF
jgi:hypothetical protein